MNSIFTQALVCELEDNSDFYSKWSLLDKNFSFLKIIFNEVVEANRISIALYITAFMTGRG